MKNIFIEHPRSTDNSQGYWEHCLFSFVNSVTLLWFCLLGIVHSFFPFVFKFSTSSAVIRSFKKLVESNRHLPEMKKYEMIELYQQAIQKVDVIGMEPDGSPSWRKGMINK